MFVYSERVSSLCHVYGEENKVTPFLKMENVFHRALEALKYVKFILHAFSLPKPKSNFLDMASFTP
jgi:hypothetical protein